MAPRKPAPRKSPASKAAPKKTPPKRTTAKKPPPKKTAPRKPAAPTKPAGKTTTRLTSAQQAVRNSLMVQRRAQNWSWEAIGEEAGLTAAAAKTAVTRHLEATPISGHRDPVKVVEALTEGIELSIGDLEQISFSALKEGEYGAAITAKRAANDARDKLLALMTATGRLPTDLSSLRHLLDVREVASQMVDSVEGFRSEVERAQELPPRRRKAAMDQAATKVVEMFEALMGFDAEEEDALALAEGGEVVDAEVVS